jgi:hypothetical protein
MAKRRHVLAGVAALATFGAVVGSAATLGGITSASLGADASVVAGCDPNGITVSYTTSFSAGAYAVSGVTLGGVDAACNGKNVRVTLADAADVSLGEASSTVGGPALTFAPAVDAAAVENVAVVIAD